jgi:glycosyltransferase involved in cell wall biosynthesis
MLLSVVIPVYNEAESLPKLFQALTQILPQIDADYELLFVNDGSNDDSLRFLRGVASSDPRVKVLGFSRNFGHQAAITAGLDFANGDAVVVMDADLQDPPELLPKMMELYRQGYDVVSAQRVVRHGDGMFKRATASLFYWIMRRMVDQRVVPEVGDFRLFSRAALVGLRRFREQHRFMRGLVAWLGLKEAIVPFDRGARAGGVTKYSFVKMLRFAWTAVSSFSALPLRLSLPFGFLMATAGAAYFAYSVYSALVTRTTVPGWTSLVCLQVVFSGATLMAVGMLGDYVARIYDEAKARPLYVIADTINLAGNSGEVARAIVLPARDEEPRQQVESDRQQVPTYRR